MSSDTNSVKEDMRAVYKACTNRLAYAAKFDSRHGFNNVQEYSRFCFCVSFVQQREQLKAQQEQVKVQKEILKVQKAILHQATMRD